MKKGSWLTNKSLVILISLFTLTFIVGLGILYGWSYYYFGTIFEDRVINEYTYQKKQDIGVNNEWIVGVTTDNIDVVEAIHGEKVKKIVEDLKKGQNENKQIYRENIDDKQLLVMIELDTKNGEQIYEYSIIRDLYMEILPRIGLIFFVFLIVIFLLAFLLFKQLSNLLYRNISLVKQHAEMISTDKATSEEIKITTKDSDIQSLIASFNFMKKRLIEKDERNQAMIGFVSHELKTPTMIIKGYTNAARDGLYPKGTLEDSLVVINEQVKRIEDKTTELLRFSEYILERNKEEKPETVNLTDTIKRTIDIFRPMSNKKIQFEARDSIYFEGYPALLTILFENLIQNQLNYSNEYIAIELFKDEPHICIRFKNDGQIVSLADYPDIFQPFSTRNPSGSGLGLEIAQEIVRLHGGKISLVSDEKATIFEILF
ncbi:MULTISPECIES: sensor histidine kinase [Lactobacillales]|uniref:histidine kinase n=1 Tax=Candidatus Vagococcus giribetii TaxID=2230876 RepID=A0ABS3HVP9_9ENTE|nr:MULTISPECIES: HAMP domain-containing sensor histidine kinase [Lactobacillales]MBO0477835.1 HAMP domain-containing histidine kinase [Vagococcus sp. DIV0080]